MYPFASAYRNIHPILACPSNIHRRETGVSSSCSAQNHIPKYPEVEVKPNDERSSRSNASSKQMASPNNGGELMVGAMSRLHLLVRHCTCVLLQLNNSSSPTYICRPLHVRRSFQVDTVIQTSRCCEAVVLAERLGMSRLQLWLAM